MPACSLQFNQHQEINDSSRPIKMDGEKDAVNCTELGKPE